MAKAKTKPKVAILNEPEPAPLAGPQTEDEWRRATIRAMGEKNPSDATRAEFRKVLERFPDVVRRYGDPANLHHNAAVQQLEKHPRMEEATRYHMKLMRAELAGDNATPTESLLADAIAACHHDYWTFALAYQQTINNGFSLGDMEKWERILRSKQESYTRAIETLVRIRRLLKLPGPQLNINMPGGQQVNIAGDVTP